MTQEEILSGNKLIAEFMGYRQAPYPNRESVYRGDNFSLLDINDAQYHSFYEWLMLAVEKIESMGFDVKIKGISCSVNRILEDKPVVSFVCGDRSKKKEIIYTAVVEFIKWYNELKS